MAMSRRLLLQSALTLFASLGLATGASTVGSGPELLHPLSVAADAANGLLVGDDGWNAVLRVDRAT